MIEKMIVNMRSIRSAGASTIVHVSAGTLEASFLSSTTLGPNCQSTGLDLSGFMAEADSSLEATSAVSFTDKLTDSQVSECRDQGFTVLNVVAVRNDHESVRQLVRVLRDDSDIEGVIVVMDKRYVLTFDDVVSTVSANSGCQISEIEWDMDVARRGEAGIVTKWPEMVSAVRAAAGLGGLYGFTHAIEWNRK